MKIKSISVFSPLTWSLLRVMFKEKTFTSDETCPFISEPN